MMSETKTPGQLAYEEDVRRCPEYSPGKPRKTWAEIGTIARQSWENNPTPREFKPKVKP